MVLYGSQDPHHLAQQHDRVSEYVAGRQLSGPKHAFKEKIRLTSLPKCLSALFFITLSV